MTHYIETGPKTVCAITDFQSVQIINLSLGRFVVIVDNIIDSGEINYFDRRLTNASAESFNAKIKAFRSQFRGVGDIKFFMFRLATLYA